MLNTRRDLHDRRPEPLTCRWRRGAYAHAFSGAFAERRHKSRRHWHERQRALHHHALRAVLKLQSGAHVRAERVVGAVVVVSERPVFTAEYSASALI